MYTALTVIACYLVIGLFMGELYDRGCRLAGKPVKVSGWLIGFLCWPLALWFIMRGY